MGGWGLLRMALVSACAVTPASAQTVTGFETGDRLHTNCNVDASDPRSGLRNTGIRGQTPFLQPEGHIDKPGLRKRSPTTSVRGGAFRATASQDSIDT